MNKNILKILLYTLLIAVLGLSVVTTTQIIKINRLNKQIELLKENSNIIVANKDKYNEILKEINNNEIYVIKFINEVIDEELYLIKIKNSNDITIYDAFIMTIYNDDDFDTFDNINYYFSNSLTDVLELKADENYYETSVFDGKEYKSLVVGLNKIKFNQNYTVVKSSY